MIDIPIFLLGISGIGISGSSITGNSTQGIGISGCPPEITIIVHKSDGSTITITVHQSAGSTITITVHQSAGSTITSPTEPRMSLLLVLHCSQFTYSTQQYRLTMHYYSKWKLLTMNYCTVLWQMEIINDTLPYYSIRK